MKYFSFSLAVRFCAFTRRVLRTLYLDFINPLDSVSPGTRLLCVLPTFSRFLASDRVRSSRRTPASAPRDQLRSLAVRFCAFTRRVLRTLYLDFINPLDSVTPGTLVLCVLPTFSRFLAYDRVRSARRTPASAPRDQLRSLAVRFCAFTRRVLRTLY